MIEILYQKYQKELMRWCLKMTGNSEFSEEYVQEAFMRAMLHEELLENMNEMQARAWLFQTVKNVFFDHKRQDARKRTENGSSDIIFEEEAFSNTEWESLLDMLPDIEGTLFAMRYLYGYNSKQLGEMFDMPSGTIRSKLSSARKHLSKMLGGESYDRK